MAEWSEKPVSPDRLGPSPPGHATLPTTGASVTARYVTLDLLKNDRLLNFLDPQVFSHCSGAQK